ncbi:MAG TPA: hypothetical protein VJZ91_18375, partial [Blastocatellia bacterium]|nr:hypothetical protein [Blastocatellia bacterium]
EAGFYVERKSGTSAFQRVGQVGVNQTSFSQAVARGTYTYRVQAFGSTGNTSAYSNKVQLSVK